MGLLECGLLHPQSESDSSRGFKQRLLPTPYPGTMRCPCPPGAHLNTLIICPYAKIILQYVNTA